MGKHTIKLTRFLGTIPVLGFFVRTRRMLASFDQFEREQLPRVLHLISELTQGQLHLSTEMSRLRTKITAHPNTDAPPVNAPHTTQVLLRTPDKFAQLMREAANVGWGWATPDIHPEQILSISENATTGTDIVAPLSSWPIAAETLSTLSMDTSVLQQHSDAVLAQQVLPYLLGKLRPNGTVHIACLAPYDNEQRPAQWWIETLRAQGWNDVESRSVPPPSPQAAWWLCARRPDGLGETGGSDRMKVVALR
ncbi:MAG: hypothetical protein E5299_01944 [Burkholderia gladioli]|nr:MAG: hypothetical protein E5299_01944 [Burkholderia gladioli]